MLESSPLIVTPESLVLSRINFPPSSLLLVRLILSCNFAVCVVWPAFAVISISNAPRIGPGHFRPVRRHCEHSGMPSSHCKRGSPFVLASEPKSVLVDEV